MIGRWWARLLRFGFRLLYNELAFTYDFVSWVVSLGAWHCWQQAAIQYFEQPTEPILELAHGTGTLQVDLQQAGYTVVGLDLSPYMGKIAKRKLEHRNLPVCLIRAKSQTLPFADQQFATVISTFPTEFILSPETLSEVHRVLQPDGRLIVVPNSEFIGGGILRTALEWLYRVTGQRGTEPPETESLFVPNGFRVEREEVMCQHSIAHVFILTKD